MPIYDECEDGYLDNPPQEPATCNNRLDHQEEDKYSKWDVYLCFSESEILCQEKIILLDEQNDMYFEKHNKNEVVNAEILNQVVDIPFENSHEHSLHGSFEDQSDKVLEEL